MDRQLEVPEMNESVKHHAKKQARKDAKGFFLV
jgi:hypothetical protein